MATTFVVADILTDAARLANVPDFTSTTNVTSTQANYWLTQAARAVSARMRQHFGDDADYIRLIQLNTTAGFNTVSLPQDCGEVQAVMWIRTASDYRLLDYGQLEHLEDLADGTPKTWLNDGQPTYRLEGETLAFYPPSQDAERVLLWYTGHLDLTNQNDFAARLDVDRWLALEVACKVLLSQSRDVSALKAEQLQLEQMLFSQNRRRQTTRTSTIRDCYAAERDRLFRSRWSR